MLNPREDKPAFISLAPFAARAGGTALTDWANVTYTEPKDKEEDTVQLDRRLQQSMTGQDTFTSHTHTHTLYFTSTHQSIFNDT